MLHVYVDLVAAGAPARERYPGMAAHLRLCGISHNPPLAALCRFICEVHRTRRQDVRW
jgi:hypothetical protein